MSTYGGPGTYGADTGVTILPPPPILPDETLEDAALIRLEEPTLGSIVFDITVGFGLLSADLGEPVIRDVVADAPNADGTIDQTALFGARNITMNVALFDTIDETATQKLYRLRGFMHPRRRCQLYFYEPGMPERCVTVRASRFSAPLDRLDYRPATLQWVAPFGVIESCDETVISLFAAAAGAELGRTYDSAYNRTYPASPVLGTTSLENRGTADMWPLIRVYGPCTDPKIENRTTGTKLEFASFTVNAGEFVEIDTRAKTIRLNGLATSSRYDKVNFTTSTSGVDLRAIPGLNVYRFYPASASTGAVAEISGRDAWL